MASSISEKTRRRGVVAVAVLAALAAQLGAIPEGHAQPAAASDATREAARRKLVEGVEAMKRSDYQAALARFEEAYALVPSPKIHYDFGLTYVGLERPADALASFERFLAEAPDAPADKREKAASLVSTLRARVAAMSGREDHAAAAAAPQAAGTPAAAPVNRPEAVAPVAPMGLVGPRDEQTTAATAASADPLRTRRIVGLSAGAAGVGLLAAGLVFGVLARRESDALTRDSEMATPGHPTPFDPGKESRGVTYERLQTIGLVAGAVVASAGIVLYTTSRRRVVVEPVAGPAVAGVNVGARF